MAIEEAKVVVKKVPVNPKEKEKPGVKQGRLIVKKRSDANRGR